ncbi:molybdenum cofactor biosynthesis protein MoaE [Gracilimonas mengyeensis]|uniref:Molybdopterin synthase catalytic subunit n=1 Tax=Gracilimonas mengyeensis TaxID=1302730 RepID=A0A521BLL4_9BACT|nr:molybdenum cofactor biosynthesis protein MoaE [Gracilimonas mengyeensis]SMO47982.1 molybdopterin synthase subunit MoaE [Gracilimonas mengyeensis]
MKTEADNKLFVHIQEELIDPKQGDEFVRHPAAGAINVFVGTTRNHHEGETVLDLYYDCYVDMAVKELRKIGLDVVNTFELEKAWIVHRIGRVPIGEASIVVAVSAAHRKQVFEATAEIMNRIKKDVPIWKKETFEDKTVWKEEKLVKGNSEK